MIRRYRDIEPMPHRRILVIKHGALGDIIQGLDGYASLRGSR